MSVQSKSGNKNVSKKKTGADVPFLDQHPLVNQLLLDIQQIAADLYTNPSLDHDGLPNLTKSLQGTTVPVGTIIPHYDFGGTVVLDANIWRYCNGTQILDTSSPLNTKFLPDLSGRYLVGFGTRNGANVGTDTWATAEVGLTANTVDFSRTITLSSSGSCSATGTAAPDGSHSHRWMTLGQYTWAATGSSTFVWNHGDGYHCPGDNGDNGTEQANFYTEFDGLHSHSVSVSGTASVSGSVGNGLPSAQEMRPNSIRVRWAMRIK